jgi:hypothetical protein
MPSLLLIGYFIFIFVVLANGGTVAFLTLFDRFSANRVRVEISK